MLVAAKVLLLVSLSCTWNVLKDANHVASDASQQDIDETDWDTPTHVWWGLRFWRWIWAPLRRRLPFLNRRPRIVLAHGITGAYEMYRVGIISIVDYLWS